MKRIILITMLCVFMLPMLAQADGTEALTTSYGNYENELFKEYINDCDLAHNHDLTKVKKLQPVAGVDIITYESEGVLAKVTTSYRFNLETKVHTVGPVFEVNLFKLIKK